MSEAIDPDIRWKDVWASIKPYERTAYDLETNTRKEPMHVVYVEVRWEGEKFTARYYVEDDDPYFTSLWTLDSAVEAIDRMLYQHGFPPYVIRSGEDEEEQGE